MDFMKLVNIFLFFVLILSEVQVSATQSNSPEYPKYVHLLIDRYEAEMQKKFGFNCIGCGGRMPYDVEMIRVGFNAQQRATVKEAREFLVYSINELVSMMNTDEQLRPFLREFPIDYKRAHVSIEFTQKNNRSYTDGSVAFIFQSRGRIYYRMEDPKTGHLIPILDESFEEALEIVKSSHGGESL